MNIVVLQGTLSAEPLERTLPAGRNVMNWDVTTETSEGKQTVPVAWDEPSKAVRAFDAGDSVVVLGSVRRRFFRTGGTTSARTEVLASAVAKPTQKAALARLLAAAEENLTS